VVEITSLQGVLGQLYAKKSGEPDDVANAIFEHYLPRFSGDNTTKSKAGLAVGLADKLDSLAGLFAAGLAPTGAKDPFAQRRAARGLVQNLIAWDVDFDLEKAITNAAEKYEPFGVSSQSKTDCLRFIENRMRNMFLEEGWPHDVVSAVLAKQSHNPASARCAVEQLSKWVEREDWHEILPEYSRCVRITRGHVKQLKVDSELFTDDAENSLLEALENVEETVERAPGSVDDFLNAFLPIIPAIKKFFDDVLVMTEDEKVRDNRLGLMWRIYALTNKVADMERLEGF
jgi:glycyl-tRNA synthetase